MLAKRNSIFQMTQGQVTKTVDMIKAWAFPSLMTLISFFLYQYYQAQQEIMVKLEEVKTQQIKGDAKTDGQFNLILFRVGALEEKVKHPN